MSKPGHSTPAYKAAAAEYRTGIHPCHIRGTLCTRIGNTVDHVPPLSTAPNPKLWRGQLLPACKPCQDQQGAHIRNHQTTRWQW